MCQATAKTEPEATRKLSHPAADTTSTISGPTTGKGLAQLPSAHTAGPMAVLEGVMQTPEEVAVMRQLLERGWSQRRIARELGISRHTVSRYLALGTWQPYDSSNRASQLDGHQAQGRLKVCPRRPWRACQPWLWSAGLTASNVRNRFHRNRSGCSG